MVKIKPSVAAMYIGVFIFVVVMISVGYHKPQNPNDIAGATNTNTLSVTANQTSVDNVVATSVAADVAQVTNLPIANNVANLAVSAKITSELAQSDDVNTTKPQLIESTEVNRSVINYAVVTGDTVDSLAAKYNISTQTIKWANNLTADTLSVDSVLRILPIDGVLYSVKSDDTIDSIAKKYAVDKTRLVLYNDLDVSGLKPNTSIILPSAILPKEERPGYVAPVTVNYYSGVGTGFGGQTWFISRGTPAGGPYSYGNCTLYAFNRRVQMGLPVGGAGGLPQWGNASSWAYMAGQVGLAVDHTPSVGAIMQNGGYLGHVAIVESILPNGDLSVSEMNAYVSGGGYNIVSGRIVSAGNVGQYLFIH